MQRKKIDWEAIEREYRAGSLSVSEIAKQNGISHQAIFQKAKKLGWKRDLSKDVRKRINQKLIADSVATCNASDEEIAEAAADRGARLVKLHRKDIANLQAEEQKILKELGDTPKKLWIGQYQGQVVKEEVGIPVTERASALQALAQVQHKRIALERQAYNLDEGNPGDPIEKIVLEFVAAKNEGSE